MENYFMCPDKKVISCSDCIKQCRRKERCLALPLLVYASRTRDLNRRHFSVTELLSPTLQMYLKATHGELIKPQSILPSAIGTACHAILEDCLPIGYAGEFRLESDGITGQMDCIDLKGKTLYDYKITSVYKVASMLGYSMYRGYKEITRGKNKGEQRFGLHWTTEPNGRHDYGDYCKQQNLYRILLAKNGIEINDMYLQCIIKEPESKLKETPLKKPCYLIKLPKMNDERLWRYAQYKKEALLHAIDTGELPRQCSPKETWNGRRCKDYCNVAVHCPYMNGGSK